MPAALNGIITMTAQNIQFPYTVGEQANIKAQFAGMSGFPNVIGAIGCTLVAIRAPSENEFVYVNRMNVRSVNVNIICDPNMFVTNFVAWLYTTPSS